DILQKAIAKAYKSISKKVSIPGFRMGKVPKKVIDTRMGKEVVYSEMLQDSISDFYNKAIDASGIEPVTQPEFDVEIENVNENAPFKFSATVEVKPEVEL
ncbi:MAG: trigger factor, partial [Candidatus Dadabacteria bacterium]|nr:trigger factor [Candidatus Dadabacteria bacterium]NIQ16541.1 trigger factor [Candidatus Dadabacteria bacterium]